MISITSAFNSVELTPYTLPFQLSTAYLPSHKKLFGIYWFHYYAMVNGSELGEVANWKGERGGTLPK